MNRRRLALIAAVLLLLIPLVWSLQRRQSGGAAAAARQAGASAAAPRAAAQGSATSSRPYKVASGHIRTESDAFGHLITDTWFEDYGLRQAVYSTNTMELLGQKVVSGTVEITADGWRTRYDVEKKEGTRSRANAPPAAPGGGAAMPQISALTSQQKLDMKAEELPPREILGRTATGMAMEVGGIKMRGWSWMGIPMRVETVLGGKEPMVVETTLLELGVPVPAEKFRVPADVKIVAAP